MTGIVVIQVRKLSGEDIRQVQGLLAEHSEWGRTRLSEEHCRLWDWRNALGRPKDMAARTLLLKLERSGHLQLPPRQQPSSNEFRNRRVPVAANATEPIQGILHHLRPLAVNVVAPASDDMHLFKGLLAGHHYLGHCNTVGENLRYFGSRPHRTTCTCSTDCWPAATTWGTATPWARTCGILVRDRIGRHTPVQRTAGRLSARHRLSPEVVRMMTAEEPLAIYP